MLFLVAGAAYVVLRAPRWVSESRVRPVNSQANSNRLSGLAAQIGFMIPTGNDPVKLYGEMVQSNLLLKRVLATTVTVRDGEATRDMTVIEMLDIGGSDERRRERRAVDELRKRIDPTTNEATGTLRLRVTLPYPEAAEKVNRVVLGLVDSMSMHLRQGQASSERQFATLRVSEAQAELRAAEDALATFLKSNKVVTAPELQAQQGRLQRQVDFRQQVAVNLAQSLEQARIDEVRNTPVLGVIDPPEGTAKLANRLADVLVWPMAGLVLAVAIALAREGGRRSAERYPAEWAQVRSLLHLSGWGRRGNAA
jgi:capsule polysaccharide export protein KpsE/RkpR